MRHHRARRRILVFLLASVLAVIVPAWYGVGGLPSAQAAQNAGAPLTVAGAVQGVDLTARIVTVDMHMPTGSLAGKTGLIRVIVTPATAIFLGTDRSTLDKLVGLGRVAVTVVGVPAARGANGQIVAQTLYIIVAKASGSTGLLPPDGSSGGTGNGGGGSGGTGGGIGPDGSGGGGGGNSGTDSGAGATSGGAGDPPSSGNPGLGGGSNPGRGNGGVGGAGGAGGNANFGGIGNGGQGGSGGSGGSNNTSGAGVGNGGSGGDGGTGGSYEGGNGGDGGDGGAGGSFNSADQSGNGGGGAAAGTPGRTLEPDMGRLVRVATRGTAGMVGTPTAQARAATGARAGTVVLGRKVTRVAVRAAGAVPVARVVPAATTAAGTGRRGPTGRMARQPGLRGTTGQTG